MSDALTIPALYDPLGRRFSVAFTVAGVPAPQGSKEKWGAESNPNTKPWRAAVASAALEAMRGHEPIADAVEVRVTFWFPRPKSHYRTGKHAHELRPDAPVYVDKKPDLDKLQRAIGDSLTGIVLRDDSQIVHWDPWKMYGAPARAEITVIPMTVR